MNRRSKRGRQTLAKELARALVNLLEEQRNANGRSALFDAAISWMTTHGLSHEIPLLPRLLTDATHERNGTLPATVATPGGSLGEESKEDLTAALEKTIGKKIMLEEQASSALLGGAIVKIGDERLDGSLQAALAQFCSQWTAPSPF